MEHRILGATGLKVSLLGFGGLGIGGGYLMKDKGVALRTVEHAVSLGINYFDTSPFVYNDSEVLLGTALKPHRKKVIIATKVELLEKHSIRNCVETSLRQLQTDYIDVLQLRDPSADVLDEFKGVCEELKSEGKIRFEAVTVGDSQQQGQAELSMASKVPVIQLAYNLIFLEAERVVLPEALKRNTGIVVRGPLCKGFLADRLITKPAVLAEHPNFAWFTSEEVDTLLQLQRNLSFLVIPGERSLAQAALQFVSRHPAVSTIIPSLETPKDVDEMAAAFTAPRLTEEEMQMARQIIEKSPRIDY